MFKHLKISTRLAAAFGLLLVLMLAVGILSSTRALAVRDQLVDITERRMPIIAKLELIRDEANAQARAIRNVALLTDPTKLAEEQRAIEQSRLAISAAMQSLESQVTSKTGQDGLAAMQEARTRFLLASDKFLELVSAKKRDEAIEFLYAETRPAQRDYFKTIDSAVEFQTKGAVDAGKEARHSVSWLVYTIAISVLTACVVAVITGARLVRSITGPLNEAVDLARAVAAGDLTKTINVRSRNEVGVLTEALADMQSGLVQVVRNVRVGAESVSSASVQIAQGNQDLSSRTESQATALEETAASMEQLSSTVRQNAENAAHANSMAQRAATVAAHGGQVMDEVVQTMKEIETGSRQIASIINIIDGIAFQTNILALNAAVEAARAGEQGRGFSVVAAEVRNLAKRSASAAKEIKDLINLSVNQVSGGTELISKAGLTMSEVVDSVRQVSQIMEEITAASKEQSEGVGQIGQAVTEMDQSTQQNAALVEEMAAAASSLEGQAADLVKSVSVFRL